MRKIWNHETRVFHAWFGFEQVHQSWLSIVISPCLLSSCASMCLSMNFLHQSLVELSLITFSPYTQHSWWWILVVLCPFAWRKKNNIMALTAGRNGNYRVHVYLVTAHAHLNKMGCGLAFSEISFTGCYRKCTMLLLAISLCLSPSWRLILQLPMHLSCFIYLVCI